MAWKRRRSAAAPQYDPAFTDGALSEACQDIAAGRWQGPRDLLAAGAAHDWDRRTHRIRLLANAAADKRVVEAWQASEPHSLDAVVLRADTEVMRMFAVARGGTIPVRDLLDHTARICLRACEAAPADPHPWLSLITLARLYEGGHASMGRWWQELRARDPYHREGHHQGLRYMSARWHGSHGQAYNFARDSAAAAPPGSALAVLPQVARAEQFRHRVEAEGRAGLDLLHHWSGDAARWDLRTTMERWLAARTVPAAQDVADLNCLAHGLVHAGMLPEAAHVFGLLDGRATRVPWSYTGDAEEQYVRWRERAAAAVAETPGTR
ncbi:hypothetical protein [Streptomyces sp. MJM1172]|uniref:hypothetical protein n=1 Tax=Streptomyces sp. MJM1172 TaxID=1703926 RepID=UPI0009397DA3|nr:hypothetical protein [Streptomyces sp. MJM1172]OKI60549.1 hypothetical protein AMK15_22430 [Streptomyces sp. MJM1172]